VTMKRMPDPRRRQRVRQVRRAESCERKTPFSSRVEAQAMRAEMTHGQVSELVVYRCTVCGLFHLGRDRKRARKMR
jgi:rubrerythrin